MTIAAKARTAAMNCEAKKHAYRQVQDGVVISFVLHPHEIPPDLASAPLGTRYVLALVEIDENEEPRGGDAPERIKSTPDASPAQHRTAGRARRSWDELSAAEQAGIRCAEPAFHRFIQERFPASIDWAGEESTPDEKIIYAVRWICGVQSRAQINPANPKALQAWTDLDNDYRLWMMVPA